MGLLLWAIGLPFGIVISIHIMLTKFTNHLKLKFAIILNMYFKKALSLKRYSNIEYQ